MPELLSSAPGRVGQHQASSSEQRRILARRPEHDADFDTRPSGRQIDDMPSDRGAQWSAAFYDVAMQDEGVGGNRLLKVGDP